MVTQTWIPRITKAFCIEVNGTFLPVNSSLIQLQPLDIITSKETSPYHTEGNLYTVYNESDAITKDDKGLEVTVVTDMRDTTSEQSKGLVPGEYTLNRTLTAQHSSVSI